MIGLPDNPLEALLAASESMRDSARKGEWESVAELDIVRRNLFAKLVRNAKAEGAHFRREMQQIFNINREVIDLASEARAEAAEEQKTITSGRHAIDSYRAAERAHSQAKTPRT